MSIFQQNTPETKPLGSKLILLYGNPGSGKSTLAAGFPKSVVIDTEGSHKYIEGVQTQARSWPEVMSAIDYLVENAKSENTQTVILDSVSKAFSYCRTFVLAREGWQAESDGEFGKGWSLPRDEFMHAIIKRLCTLRDRGIGVVLVTHQDLRTVSSPLGDFQRFEAEFPDSSSNKRSPTLVALEKEADMLLHYSTDAPSGLKERALYAQDDGRRFAKDRSGCMPAKFDLPEVSGSPTERAHAVFAAVTKAYEGA